MTNYKGGRILRLKLVCFMAYDQLELFPKRGLNFIIGLNGSGKSSIMCAICLVLGGKPQFTGREIPVHHFIKHGCKNAVIEIELERVSEENAIIVRRITQVKSEWSLNGVKSLQSEIAEFVAKFNINTGNLYQFLPQEKVMEFSKMDKRKRLRSLLEAIGDRQLCNLFNELQNLKSEYCQIEETIRRQERNKNTAQQKNMKLLPDIDKLEERERLKEELKLWKLHKMQLEYDDLRYEHNEMKKQKNECVKQKAELEKQINEAKDLEKNILMQCQLFSDVLNDQKVISHRRDIMKNIEELKMLNGEVHQAKINHVNKIVERKLLQKRLEELTEQIQNLQSSMNSRKANNEMKDIAIKVKEIDEESKKLNCEIMQLYLEKDIIEDKRNRLEANIENAKTELSDLENEHQKKIELLKRLDKEAYEVVQWLEINKNKFKSTVYKPIFMELKIANKEDCKYIENYISKRDLLGFVCEDQEDCKLLSNIVHSKGWHVNIFMAPKNSMSDFKSPTITPQQKKFGISSFLVDLFSAPQPIMRFLCACFHIHKVPVIKNPAGLNDIESLVKHFMVFYAADTKVKGVRSKYGKRNWSILQDKIINHGLLVYSLDRKDDTRKIKDKIKDVEDNLISETKILENLEEKLEEKNKLLEQYRQEKNMFASKKRNIDVESVQLQQREETYSKIMSRLANSDERSERSKTIAAIRSINSRKQNILNEQHVFFQNLLTVFKEKIKSVISASIMQKKLRKQLNRSVEIKKVFDICMEEFEKIREKKTNIFERGKALKEEIISSAPLKSTQNVIANLRAGMEETEQKIVQLQAELDLGFDFDDSVVEEYRKQIKIISETESNVQEYNKKLQVLKNKMDSLKDQWLPKLQSHIMDVNKKFSHYFKQLNCAGEISLDVAENTDDFLNYGLQIMLKYRGSEPFMELSKNHHSGGECSVAAVIFILSLQELTDVPFRCIDEINQGMDCENERKIYQFVADSVDMRSSQYFVLTPKLLKDMSYPENAGVHILYSSGFINTKISVQEFLVRI